MDPKAYLRMTVYQEGQRAFNSGAPCLYNDWRAKTWAKGFEAAKVYHERLLQEPETVDCKWCSKPTLMTATKTCDSCWELETRIHRHPGIARRILNSIKS